MTGDTTFRCYFCGGQHTGEERTKWEGSSPTQYTCVTCGYVYLTEECADDFTGENFTDHQRRILSIWFRNEHESRGRKPPKKTYTLTDLHQIVEQYSEMDALEKMDKVLETLHKVSHHAGHRFSVNTTLDFPHYHCFSQDELASVLVLLAKEGFIYAEEPENPHRALRIGAKGYERLRDLRKSRKDSRQCFVAMWLDPGMNDVYTKAIVPAIEYVEQGESEPRFRALRIDNKEHANDINDEIIAEIRRSRFMVCDLTGYRGGVYFEAGFAYGLGLEVIYTCREDWLKTHTTEIELKDGTTYPLVQEGIHFDLEHRNRIPWREDDLDGFKEKLINRIKAVII